MKNYGLASQWFFAWIPEDENEVAFIFEDDVEVLESEHNPSLYHCILYFILLTTAIQSTALLGVAILLHMGYTSRGEILRVFCVQSEGDTQGFAASSAWSH